MWETENCECVDDDTALLKYALSLINELTEENERLNSELSVKKKLLKRCSDLVERIQADTVKEMQERIAQFFDGNNATHKLLRKAVDRIAKELLEGTNERK